MRHVSLGTRVCHGPVRTHLRALLSWWLLQQGPSLHLPPLPSKESEAALSASHLAAFPTSPSSCTCCSLFKPLPLSAVSRFLCCCCWLCWLTCTRLPTSLGATCICLYCLTRFCLVFCVLLCFGADAIRGFFISLFFLLFTGSRRAHAIDGRRVCVCGCEGPG